MYVYRCYTEKKESLAVEANSLLGELRGFLGIDSLESLRILNRYDTEGISQHTYLAARDTVFSEPRTDIIYDESPPDFGQGNRVLTIEAVPGQYDQRAHSCEQCLRLLEPAQSGSPIVHTAKMYVFFGQINDAEMDKIREYLINPVECREASQDKPSTLVASYPDPEPVETLHGFTGINNEMLGDFLDDYNLAMDMADLRFLQSYFRDTEKRDPTITELRMIDTYWSDHCRHTTFFTHITDISISDPVVQTAYEIYQKARNELYGDSAQTRPETLMDIATIAAKVLKKRGILTNVEESEEVNACSVYIKATVDGETEDWLLMFKNETHNHPTEIEPFGGASTCVGGAIRDPLSGRAYVYQAMRITGAGDPRVPIADTLQGKIPQRKLTSVAALGNSTYGNQIGLTSGYVHELYHPGYIAKRMELGAVVGAVKADNVRRETPIPGDRVLLVGARTGRDGIGGATGSSKAQTGQTFETMAAEVQKGNAPEERKIQRLFLNPEVTKMIKKSNDFGAGGVSVAVGELADGVDIDLSLVRPKYEGLDGTELAISESQERMAVVIAASDVERFIDEAEKENLEAYVIAEVTDSSRVVMRHNGSIIVDLSREFLSTNGAVKTTSVSVAEAASSINRSTALAPGLPNGLTQSDWEKLTPKERLIELVSDLRFCSQRGLYEMFDGTIGAGSVLMKNGGKTQSTPAQSMAALLPVIDKDTSTCSVMAYGFDPYLSSENPFIGARTAVISSVAKLVAAGCDPDTAHLSFQEFFERLHDDPSRWGKPFSALLGAFDAQMGLELAAIGGKDSMSGSYNDIDVPPTLVSFAIAPNDAAYVISPEFKNPGNDVVVFEASESLGETKNTWKSIRKLIEEKTIISAWATTEGGVFEGIFKMSLGNEIGFEFTSDDDYKQYFKYAQDPCAPGSYSPGTIIAEVTRPVPFGVVIGRTTDEPAIRLKDIALPLAELKAAWESTLESVFPTKTSDSGNPAPISYETRSSYAPMSKIAKPRALILAFPGTSGEYDAARAVSRAGGIPQTIVVRNMTGALLEDSISQTVRELSNSQMLIIPAGLTLGDEPDGAAKFIASFFMNPILADAVHEHLKTRGGLMLGLGNGFQALIKLGLLPYGEILPPNPDAPTLTHNRIGRHQAGYVYTRVASVNSPWMSLSSVGDIHTIPISHSEGRFIATEEMLQQLSSKGQIASQYTDSEGQPSMDTAINPNASMLAIEGLFSPDGRVFGKMGHSERFRENTAINIYGNKQQPIFESGIEFFS